MAKWKEKVKPNPASVKKHKRMVRREADWIECFKQAEMDKTTGETVEYVVVKNLVHRLATRRKYSIQENRVLEKGGKLATVSFLVPECGAAIKVGGGDVCWSESEVLAHHGLQPLRIKPQSLHTYGSFRAMVSSVAALLNRPRVHVRTPSQQI